MPVFILEKLKKSGLTGRGGACFPVWLKWKTVKDAPAEKKFVVANASEGEPGVNKDGYLLKNYPERVVDGLKIAINFLDAERGFIYINRKYYIESAAILRKIIGDFPIEVFLKPEKGGYVGGEESSILNAIEGRRIEPRLRPPFPVEHGLWGYPTLVNNVETFYDASLIAAGIYAKKRFFSIYGDCSHDGVYECPENWTIEKILKETKNYPNFDFFVQTGGGAAGEVLNQNQLKRRPAGAGSILVYSLHKHQPIKLITKWVNFFVRESCGKCTPCREGISRMKEIVDSTNPAWGLFSDLLDNLSESAFCGLGCALPVPIKSYVKNVLPLLPLKNIKIGKISAKSFCECFR